MKHVLTSLKGAEREALVAYEGDVTVIRQGDFRDTLPNSWQALNVRRMARNRDAWVAHAARLSDEGRPTTEIARAVGKSVRRVNDALRDLRKKKEAEAHG